MVEDSQAAGTKPLVVLDAAAQVLALERMDAKAFRKSMESGELWVHDATGRVLPLPVTRGMAVQVRETASWYEARLRDRRAPPAAASAAAAGGAVVADRVAGSETEPARPTADAVLQELEQLIRERRRALPEGSYTSYLFREGNAKIRKKLGEEAIEVITAGSAAEVAGEAADLLYHLLVLLVAEQVSLDQVVEVLAARAG